MSEILLYLGIAVSGILGLAALAFIIWSAFGVLFLKGRRKRKLGHAGIGFVTLIIAVIGLALLGNWGSRQEGFLSATDQQAAKRAGIEDPKLWAEKRQRILAEQEAEDKEIAAAQRKKEEDEANAAAAAAAEKERQQAEARATEERKKQEAKAAEEAACREDLKCWGEKASVAAAVYCPAVIERMAKYDFEWTDGFLEPKFSHYRWSDRDRGIVTMLGDKVKFQNGFGAWTYMTYECDIDPVAETILDVRVHQGRL